MLLRANNVDIATIALWLGHEMTQTTHIDEHADPALKETSRIAQTAPLGAKPGTDTHAPDELLAFLLVLRLCGTFLSCSNPALQREIAL